MFTEWEHGRLGMVQAVHDLLSEADAVVTYNGDKFDLPKLRGEFALAKIPLPPPSTSIDVYKAVKRLGFISNKLAYIGPLLTHDEKIKHEGFGLWLQTMAGCPKAQRRMTRYCGQDVRLLQKVYERMVPYISDHPHLGHTCSTACGACGSRNTQHRGFRRTKIFKIERLQCQECGSWQSGKKSRPAILEAA